MKKALSLFLALVMCLSLCACGGGNTNTGENNNPGSEKVNISEFPFIGTWANEEMTVFLRIEENGKITTESIAVNNSTSTVNGVTTTKTTKTIHKNTSYTWSIENDKFMFNKATPFTPCKENGQYTLAGEKITYIRVGESDYVINLEEDETGTSADIVADSKEYTIGDVIKAEGIELVFEEKGLKSDIRITSDSSGIKMTSGPSTEAGKQYVYLKGTLKNTGKTALRCAIGGTIYLNDYEFELKTDTISTEGSPASSVDPLETVHILLYAQISDEMADIFTEGKIIFGFNDNFSDVMVENAQHLYYVNITP